MRSLARLATVAVGLALIACTEPAPRGRARPSLPTAERPPSEGATADARPPAGPWESQSRWSDHLDWEPVVGADPGSGRVYQLATRYGADDCPACPDPVIVLRRSIDVGRSWEGDAYPFRDGRWQADPQVAVAADGTVFAAFLQGFRPGAMLARSEDGGVSWSGPVAVTGAHEPSWSDKPWLTVSPDGADVYVALNASDSYIAASHDGGRSFAPPVRTSTDARYWFHGGGDVAHDGTVAFAATDYRYSYLGRVHVNVIVSRDAGASWQTVRVDTSEEAQACDQVPGCYHGFLGPQASIAVDQDGTWMLVYNLGRRAGRPQKIYFRTSRDALAWNERQPVDSMPLDAGQAFAAVANGPQPGDFHVVWQDDRRDPGARWNTWYRRTRDGGVNWSRRHRLSLGGPPAPYADAAGYSFPYGDYLGLDVDGAGRAHAIWGAGESYSGYGNVWFARQGDGN